MELELRRSAWSRTTLRVAASRPPKAVLEQADRRSKDRLQDIKAYSLKGDSVVKAALRALDLEVASD
jgi:hypothetical protein